MVDRLPDEVWIEIFCGLESRLDLYALRLVCKHWKKLLTEAREELDQRLPVRWVKMYYCRGPRGYGFYACTHHRDNDQIQRCCERQWDRPQTVYVLDTIPLSLPKYEVGESAARLGDFYVEKDYRFYIYNRDGVFLAKLYMDGFSRLSEVRCEVHDPRWDETHFQRAIDVLAGSEIFKTTKVSFVRKLLKWWERRSRTT